MTPAPPAMPAPLDTPRDASKDSPHTRGDESFGSIVLKQPLLQSRGEDEWLLTNGLGGFAMGTPHAGLDRRYHAWLVGAVRPPVGRVVALSACAEWLVIPDRMGPDGKVLRIDLSTFSFAQRTPQECTSSPTGLGRLERFERSERGWCSWTYRVLDASTGLDARITRTLFVHRERNASSIAYEVEGSVPRGAFLEVRPLTPLRDFHDLTESEQLRVETSHDASGVRLTHRLAEVRMLLREGGGRFVDDPQWWRDLCYRKDALRGQAWREHLWSPGCFVAHVDGGLAPEGAHTPKASARRVLELLVGVGEVGDVPPLHDAMRGEAARLDAIAKAAQVAIQVLGQGAAQALPEGDAALAAGLARACDQFVVRRFHSAGGGDEGLTSVIAGYPWFSDWGRDTCIALPGLLLACGRNAEALGALRAFASLRRKGLVPNCFDNGNGVPEYNTVDASLWFVIACCRYVRASGDVQGFDQHLRTACLDVVDAYRAGTDFGIKMDAKDGLVDAGDASTQLTWMDAKRDGVVFTPRHGKPVEVNALWYNALLLLSQVVEARTPRTARELAQVADLCGKHFERAYWDTGRACLHDIGYASTFQMRPNQVFAIALEHSPVGAPRQSAILEAVRHALLTPEGLRTLAQSEPGYCPRYEGSLWDRDRAYHNGTVWPWLLGPFCEAMLRVQGFSPTARERVRAIVRGAAGTLRGPTSAGEQPQPLGSIAEVYEAEVRSGEVGGRRSDGCPMQAWSVAELLRALVLAAGPAQAGQV